MGGILRDYTADEVVRLRGSIREQHTLALRMSQQLWDLLTTEDYVSAWGRSAVGRCDGEGGPQGDLPLRLAGRR